MHWPTFQYLQSPRTPLLWSTGKAQQTPTSARLAFVKLATSGVEWLTGDISVGMMSFLCIFSPSCVYIMFSSCCAFLLCLVYAWLIRCHSLCFFHSKGQYFRWDESSKKKWERERVGEHFSKWESQVAASFKNDAQNCHGMAIARGLWIVFGLALWIGLAGCWAHFERLLRQWMVRWRLGGVPLF